MAANASAAEPEADREVIVTRTYDAPARLLFEAWTKAEHLMKWFGPKSWPVTTCTVDFREGGRWRMVMTGPNGKENTPFGGEYLEIVPDRRIVLSNGFELPGAEKMIWTVTFDEKGGRTVLTVRTLFPSIAQKAIYIGAGFEMGLGQGLDQLTGVVAAMAGKKA